MLFLQISDKMEILFLISIDISNQQISAKRGPDSRFVEVEAE